MARARNIKPGFFMNDLLAKVDPLGRILFIGLWTIADREGRLEDRPLRIKAEVLPYDNCDIVNLLDQLEINGFIQRYSIDGSDYIQVINFTKHQNPHHREKESEIPPPPSTEGEPRESLEKAPESTGQVQRKPGASTGQSVGKPEVKKEENPSLAAGKASLGKARDNPQESPEQAVLIPDTGYLIPDSGYPHPDSHASPKQADDDDADNNSNREIIKVFAQTFGYPPNQTQLQMLLSFLDDGLPDELILEALKRSAETGASSPRYTTAILQSWVSKSVYTLDDVKALDNLKRPRRSSGPVAREDFTYTEPQQDLSFFTFLHDDPEDDNDKIEEDSA